MANTKSMFETKLEKLLLYEQGTNKITNNSSCMFNHFSNYIYFKLSQSKLNKDKLCIIFIPQGIQCYYLLLSGWKIRNTLA